jgi:DNA replication licensing factor MCM4
MDARPSSDAEDGPTTLSYVWGTNINVPDVTNAIARFLQNYRASPEDMEAKYIQLIEQATEREEDTLNIDASNVYEHDPDLYSKIVRYPLDIIPLLDVACMEEAVKIKPDYEKAIEARPFNLRESVNMRDLNPSDIDKLVSVKGMVIRCSSIIPEIKEAFFRCLVCNHSPKMLQVIKGRVEEPTRCEKPECAARNSLALIHNRCT